MTMAFSELAMALTRPVQAAYLWRARRDPAPLFARYGRLAREAGLRDAYLVVSFDCDTPEDIGVVLKMHGRVSDLGLRPVYAVPGELLERGEKVYQRIAADGAEFLNHGYTMHVRYDAGQGGYRSHFFYDRLPRDQVRRDIVDGDRAVKRVLGFRPRGFRAPHFGTFQRPSQLRFLHRVLAGEGYEFSSSTSPFYGFRYGAVFSRFGLKEFPVSGMWSAPLNVLDTWSCFGAPDRGHSAEDYRREGVESAHALVAGGAGILNFYGDPLHIHDQEAFYDTLSCWKELGTPAAYSDLLQVTV